MNKPGFFTASAIFIAAIICKPILIFTIPGILIMFIPCFNKLDLSELIIYIIGVSTAFWISSFWFLKYIGMGLSHYFFLTVLITLIIFLYLLLKIKSRCTISAKPRDFFVIAVFLFVLILRFAPMKQAIVPAGADMSMHTYITRLIVKANGVPESYRPILGIDTFGSFPVGFHTISALISLIADLPDYRSTFAVSCLTYVFFTMFLFVLLKNFVDWKFALISALTFSFFTNNPQHFAVWGGTPTILAMAFLVFLMSTLEKLDNKWMIAWASLFLSAVLLTHTIMFIQSFYILGLSLLPFLIFKKDIKSLHKYFLIVLYFFIIITPYLLNLDKNIATPETIEWIKTWVRTKDHCWKGNVYNFLWTIPSYINSHIFTNFFRYYIGFFSFLGFILLSYQNNSRIKAIQLALFCLGIVLLILNAQYWVIPFSYGIYPERTATMMVIPFSIFFAFGLSIPFKYFERCTNQRFIKIVTTGLIIMTLVFIPSFNKIRYIKAIAGASAVTQADLKAFKWLEENTQETDVIQNNYGDGGLWIPAIIGRPITEPHINVVYLDKIEPASSNSKYAYLGKRQTYYCRWNNSHYKDKGKFRLEYSEGQVKIFKILN